MPFEPEQCRIGVVAAKNALIPAMDIDGDREPLSCPSFVAGICKRRVVAGVAAGEKRT